MHEDRKINILPWSGSGNICKSRNSILKMQMRTNQRSSRAKREEENFKKKRKIGRGFVWSGCQNESKEKVNDKNEVGRAWRTIRCEEGVGMHVQIGVVREGTNTRESESERGANCTGLKDPGFISSFVTAWPRVDIRLETLQRALGLRRFWQIYQFPGQRFEWK